MDEKVLQVKSEKIGEIFHTMDYGDAERTLKLARTWLEEHGKCIKPHLLKPVATNEEQIHSVLDSSELLATVHVAKEIPQLEVYKTNLKATDVAFNMLKFADAIEKQMDLICELEMAVRGILLKDTKKTVSLFVDYVRYYSGWVKLSNDKVTPYFISDQDSLRMFGFYFASMLACQRNIQLVILPRMMILISLLVETAINSGFPKELFSYIAYDEEVLNPGTSKNKIPMIIFNNADLDSAIDVAVRAAWDLQGMLPESVGTLLVQEDILDDFLKRLKSRLQTLRMGAADDKQADVAYPYMVTNYKDKLDKMVQDATLMGIDVYRTNSSSDFTPTLFIGGRVHGNNVIINDKLNIPTLTILAFRNTNEAVNLANNNRQSRYASVWSENIGQINEVTKKLNVGTIWVNMHGKFEADVSFTQWNSIRNFGGQEGGRDVWRSNTNKDIKIVNKSEGQDLHSIVAGLKKNQSNWNKLTLSARLKILKNLAVSINKNKEALSKETSYTGVEDWISKLLNAGQIRTNNNSSVNEYDIKSYTESLGVIALISDSAFYHNLITMLAQGNAVVVLYQELDPTVAFLKEVQKCLPGIFNVVEITDGILAKLPLENDLVVFTTLGFKTKGIERLIQFDDTLNLEANDVVRIKNVWSNRGESFI